MLFRSEKKYSRVLKEAESLDELKFKAHGPKARTLVQQITTAQTAAQQSESQRAQLTADLAADWKAQRYAKIEPALRAYENLTGELTDDMKAMRQRLPALLAIQTEEARQAQVETFQKQGRWSEALDILAPPPRLDDAAANTEDQDRATVLRQRREVTLAELEERVVAVWTEAVLRLACAPWPLDPIRNALNELNRRSLPVEDIKAHKCRLLQKLYQLAAEQDEWTTAQVLAVTWAELAPADANATQAVQRANNYLEAYAQVGQVVQLFRDGDFAACAERCQRLLEKNDGDFNIAVPGYTGTCSELEAKARQKQAEVERRLTEINGMLNLRRWVSARMAAEAIMKTSPRNQQARASRQRAASGLLRRRVWQGVAALLIGLAQIGRASCRERV